jgi:hypothetical protein
MFVTRNWFLSVDRRFIVGVCHAGELPPTIRNVATWNPVSWIRCCPTTMPIAPDPDLDDEELYHQEPVIVGAAIALCLASPVNRHGGNA